MSALVPTGVYMNGNRNTAIVVRCTQSVVWYLTMASGNITTETCGDEKFIRDFYLRLPDYPILRAVRKFHESHISRDEQSEKIMQLILRKDQVAAI